MLSEGRDTPSKGLHIASSSLAGNTSTKALYQPDVKQKFSTSGMPKPAEIPVMSRLPFYDEAPARTMHVATSEVNESGEPDEWHGHPLA